MSAIEKNSVVSLKYQLKSQDGDVLDEADAKDPFVYLHGAGQIVPGLENALEGLTLGDKKDVVVQPEQGYGVDNDKLRISVKKSEFPENQNLEVGMEFLADVGQAHPVIFRVMDIKGEDVFVDGNHPLAGHTLHFSIEVLAIREATEEERQHGHAHGVDGKDHHH